MRAYRLLDLFCGAGGLSTGFERNSFEVIQAIDINRHAIETYNYNRMNKVAIIKDIKEIDKDYLEKLGEVDGVIGGPPCQGFSTAGQRIIDDDRNILYRDYFMILEILRPKFFFLENVTGMLTFANGIIKQDIFFRAQQMGYKMYMQVIDAVDFGIPQHRKRALFIGIRDDIHHSKFIFPKGNENEVAIIDAIDDLPSLDKNEDNTKYSKEPRTNYEKYIRNGATVLTNHMQSSHTEEVKRTIGLVPEGGDLRDLPKELRGNRNYRALMRKMDRNKASFTIDTGHRTYFHYEERRVPSVRESARLQSFYDDYVFLGPKQEQYKQVGNAVPPLLAEIISKEIEKYLKAGENI